MRIKDYLNGILNTVASNPHVKSQSISFEERPPNAAYITGTVTFFDLSKLYFKEFVVFKTKSVNIFKYGYSFLGKDDTLIFRYDNAFDPEGKEINFVYDLEGRLVKTIDGNGNEIINEYTDLSGTTCPSCSGAGGTEQPTRIIYPTYTKEFKYDSRGRKTEEKDILSANESYSAQFAYDATGNPTSETDKESNVTTYMYDELNRKIKVIDSLSNNTEFTYNDRDNLIALKDANGNVTNFEYNRNNRLIKETRPMGEITTYQYDGAGNLIQKIDAKNQMIEYKYDDVGRRIEIKNFSASDYANPAKTVTFTYDKAGNLKTYNDSATSATYLYDDSYRKTSETINYGSFALTYSYAYNKNGLKKNFTAPDGSIYEYIYDSSNQPAGISIPGQGYITYNSYTWNRPASITLPGGTRKEYTYDPLMRMKSITVKDPGTNPFMTYNYQYAPAGNISAKDTEHGNYSYQYDDLYRLTNADNATVQDEAYTYDAVGNRLTSANVTGAWSYNQNNELLNYDGVSNEYDNNGNTTSKTDNCGTTTYQYDAENRLIGVNGFNPNCQPLTATYYYDLFGRRLWKDVNGVRTYFHYSDEGLIGEYDSSGTEIKTYGYEPGSTWTTNPLFQKVGTTYYWYQNDHLGTPQKITDTSGRTVWSASYNAFGNIQTDIAEIENNLRFPGQYYDAETGLYYNYHRYYSPEIGMYIEADPIGLIDGINLYVYSLNNPISRFDIDGRESATTSDMWTCIANPFDCNQAMKCRDKALQATITKFGHQGHNDAADAFRHCYWSCCMAQKIGASEAKKFGDSHEDNPKQPKCEKDMDLFNNATGRMLGASNPNGDCGSLCTKTPLQNKPKDCDACGKKK